MNKKYIVRLNLRGRQEPFSAPLGQLVHFLEAELRHVERASLREFFSQSFLRHFVPFRGQPPSPHPRHQRNPRFLLFPSWTWPRASLWQTFVDHDPPHVKSVSPRSPRDPSDDALLNSRCSDRTDLSQRRRGAKKDTERSSPLFSLRLLPLRLCAFARDLPPGPYLRHFVPFRGQPPSPHPRYQRNPRFSVGKRIVLKMGHDFW
jgi:hypothetical protein